MQPRRLGRSRAKQAPDDLLEQCARRLARAPISALFEELASALEAIGRRVRADRMTLWDVRGCDRRLVLLQQWAEPGCALHVPAIPADEHPWISEHVACGRTVTFRSCAALPREAHRERKFYARHGPRSAAIHPIVVGEATVGVLVAGTVRRERSWGSVTLATLDRAAVVLASALVRKRAHDASLETEARLSGVLESGPDGILLVRRKGRIELANGRATAIFLRTSQELRAERLQDLLAPAPGALGMPGRSAIDALLASDEPLSLLARRADGTSVPVEVTLRPLREPGDDLFCCGIRDASEDHRAREEAARLRDELALMGRTAMLAEMGAGIAHELNQPLTAILSNAESAQRLLRSPRAVDGDELREALRDVVSDTRRAASVLSRMREMLRRRDVERVPVDVDALLASVARRFREESIARSIQLTVEVAPALPPVLGDPIQLEQVAMNLVLNAFEALGPGKGPPRTIAVRARATLPDGVTISVRDSGPGLDEKALAHAFDAFFTTKPRGLGMGLPISRSIVEAHGGRILARNNSDRGATFEFHVPAAPGPGVPHGRRTPA